MDRLIDSLIVSVIVSGGGQPATGITSRAAALAPAGPPASVKVWMEDKAIAVLVDDAAVQASLPFVTHAHL